MAEREVYVHVPPDVPMPKNTCVLLLRSSHGFQDAAGIWQKDYTGLLVSDGWIRGKGYVAVFRHPNGALLLVHGDDFCVLGDEDQQQQFAKLLSTRYE